ncbi:NAD/FAD-binding protein [Alsobacter metallidurans]|uniref:NAD/FAD-binding protein n=1 Tax=Alsobacter metallidurans TaxID=340221 RepID=A0A917I9B1_9HYPH|nr:FAD-dependent oxidoreductase [Alsobacter metallidurans]GGH22598.1 NAD/FAD-binding protein [Alsobacter metallidurans]
MRIAIIGTGISGNAAAYALATSTGHRITVYERDIRPGGHSATVDIDYDGARIAVDTGFIVYNEANYENLTALFAELGVKTEASDMSFAVSARGGRFEWCGRTTDTANGLFAQRRNLLSPGYLRMLVEVLRFNRVAIEDREAGRLNSLSLDHYVTLRGFSKRFRDDYLVPMGAAIWSMSPRAMLAFPAESFIAFFQNHHLLQWERPVWRTVNGGSRSYVEKITAPFRDRIRLGSAVTSVVRTGTGVEVTDASGEAELYDHVIFAAHSDQTLAMLKDASPDEEAVLGAVGYRENAVYLHRDPSLMPRRRRAWSAWNVMQNDDPDADLCVTYWMNLLQNIDPAKPLFVTLNPPKPPRDDLTFARFAYAHPQYDTGALAAQKRLSAIQGQNRTWFCGAWTAHGFHEDGLKSGLTVAEALGASVSWRRSPTEILQAAE